MTGIIKDSRTMIILVLLILTCTGLWDRSLSVFVDGQSCVDGERFEERVAYIREGMAYQLNCSLEPSLLQSSEQIQLTWLKDCVELPAPALYRPERALLTQERGHVLIFPNLGFKDQGNYTCLVRNTNTTTSFTARLTVKEAQCSKAPTFKPSGGLAHLWGNLDSTLKLNCTAVLPWDASEQPCDTSLRWSLDGRPLINQTVSPPNTSLWSPSRGHLIVSSLLEVTLGEQEDFGLYSCSVRNLSADFSVLMAGRPSHTAAVMAASLLLFLLSTAVLVYSRCHLNIKLWYRSIYGDYELNDGKLYDAYISYVNNEYDKKFVNFIIKPNLTKHGHKLHLNDNNILPGTEPSAELLMNVSRSRRLIVVLSHAYLEQDWCCNNFRQGLLQLLELCQRPIIIRLEGQMKRMKPEVQKGLREQQHRLTMLTWRHNSVNPSSVFWKELVLALPRRVLFRCESAGDPQTMLQEDKDPMLTLNPDHLECHTETDPAGDLGLRFPVYKAMTSRVPVLQATPTALPEPKSSDIDVSDLGSRNYAARTDFYCLVTEEDM